MSSERVSLLDSGTSLAYSSPAFCLFSASFSSSGWATSSVKQAFSFLPPCSYSPTSSSASQCFFMISRALGPEFGGSIGVIFYFANAFSTGVYVLGVVEALTESFGEVSGDFAKALPAGRGSDYLFGTAVLIICLIVCLVGPQMFAKTTFVIFVAVMVVAVTVIINFLVKNEKPIKFSNVTYNYTGFSLSTFENNLLPNFTTDYTTGKEANFAIVFGVLFNGCTGIMAGANLSGDLAKPSRAIPLGTILASVCTFVVYEVIVFLLAATCDRSLLVNDFSVLQSISFLPPLVATGVLMVTLSAALSTFIGATRILHAVSDDDIFGVVLRPFRRVTSTGNPYMAILLTWLLVQAIIAVGELNTLAPFATGFFLLSYSATNLACLALDLASAPNFRPTFRYYSWLTALLGVISTFSMMFVVNQVYAGIAVGVMLLLYIFIHFYSSDSSWGDISQALIFHQVRKYLLLLDPRRDHVKFWRPQILLLVNNPRASTSLIQFVNDMKKGGLYVVGHVIVGSLKDGASEQRDKLLDAWANLVQRSKVKAFIEVTFGQSVRLGAQSLAMTSGLGGMKPRTVVLGFYDAAMPVDGIDDLLPAGQALKLPLSAAFPPVRSSADERQVSPEEYVAIIRDCLFHLKKNVVLARHFSDFNRGSLSQHPGGYIDIWPVNARYFDMPVDYQETAYDYLLQIGCVLHMVPLWKKTTRIRAFAVGVDVPAAEANKEKLKQRLADVRIPATVYAVVPQRHSLISDSYDDPKESIIAVNELMRKHSSHSLTKVVLSSLWDPPADPLKSAAYLASLEAFTEGLPPTLLLRGLSTVMMITQ